MESVGFFLRTAVSLAKIRFSRAGGRPYFDRLKLADPLNMAVRLAGFQLLSPGLPWGEVVAHGASVRARPH